MGDKRDPDSRLRFEQDAPEKETTTSGRNVQKSRRDRRPAGDAGPEPVRDTPAGGGKLKQDREKPRPSDRLRGDDRQAPPPGGEETVPPGGASAAGGGSGPHEGTRPGGKKGEREKRRFDKSGRRVEKSGAKLDKARDKLENQKPPKKPGPIKKAGGFATHEVWRYTHGKIRQVEQENVGVEAGHKTELAGESTLRGGTRFVKKRVRTRPARQVRKWEKKNLKFRAEHEFHKQAQEHPDLKKNALTRMWHKRRIKKQYQKQAREAAKQSAKGAKKAAGETGRLFRAVGRFVAGHPKVMLLVAVLFLLIIILQSCVGMFTTIGSGIAGVVGGTSYLAEDGDIDAAELAYTEWETDLYLEAMNAESAYPGYDEYRYNVAEISHNPYELMAYLTAAFDDFSFSDSVTETKVIEVGAEIGQVRTSAYCACSICCGPYANGITASGTTATAGRTIAVDAYNPLLPMGTKVVINGIQYTVEDTGNLNANNVDFDIFFSTHAEALAWGKQTHTAYLAEGNENSLEVTITTAGVAAHLREIFNQQYTLTFEEEVEVRYRTETRIDSEGNSYTVEVAYDYYILNIDLTAQSFTGVVYGRMDAEQLERYNIYMVTKGNRQYLQSPFGETNWLPYVSSYYGYRVHPISGGKNLHRGVDIGMAEGTEILAGQSGTVTFAGTSGDYGLVVVLDDGEGLVSKYAHCSALLVSAGQTVEAGDVIALVGSTGSSTGAHLHLEILKDGQYLNPLYFAVTNDYDGGPVYGDGGAAMGDGSYAALIAEAEKHLGKPYVFGASGPDSFDCSSYICWIFTHSGVYNLPRTTAQGIYNQCTPISASEAKPGDIVFFHSTYSTTDTVTHVGLYVGNGMMIHCGKPVQYTSINTSYWQSHLYSFGRLPTN